MLEQDAAESVGIPNLPDSMTTMLASDVEYRIHQILEVSLASTLANAL